MQPGGWGRGGILGEWGGKVAYNMAI